MAELVEVKNLKKYFDTKRGKVHAVDDITMTIKQGETMGVVGESGCGKSTLGRVLTHLEDSTEGSFTFDGKDVTILKGHKLRNYRTECQIIFQDPYSSLDPRYTVEDTIREPMRQTHKMSSAELDKRTAELMDLVGIAKRLRMAYPHELDGGRRQRVGIARALALDPKFIVCDEPVSALDVSIQAQVLNLLQDLQKEKGLTYMFITHDLSVVRHISDNISVMYLGQLVETSPAKDLFKKQYHPYTKALLSAIPSMNIHKKSQRILLKGEITSPINPKPGCRFAARCMYATEACHQPQTLEEIVPGRFVSCCRAKELSEAETKQN
ncbi:MAG: ABC transporter ATP-binding protein [Oscillospiraceae bacterium]